MQCFICVAYLMIICNAHPPSDREVSKPYQRRSLFHDVIESIRLRSRLPENLNQNEDNSLEPHFENYGFQNELLHLPSDSNYTPRRNDRIEMPPLKYRFPKNLKINASKDDAAKEEIVLYVNTPSDINDTKPSTQKPKKQKPKPKPTNNRVSIKNKEEEESTEPPFVEERPISNTMSGQSQIGNRDSQTVVKPTVIVNFRGSVNHRESEIRLERRKNENITKTVLPQNIFNINQEIKLEKMDEMGSTGMGKAGTSGKIKQHISFVPERHTKADPRTDEDLLMCETGWQDKNRASGKRDTIQILFSLQ